MTLLPARYGDIVGSGKDITERLIIRESFYGDFSRVFGSKSLLIYETVSRPKLKDKSYEQKNGDLCQSFNR